MRGAGARVTAVLDEAAGRRAAAVGPVRAVELRRGEAVAEGAEDGAPDAFRRVRGSYSWPGKY